MTPVTLESLANRVEALEKEIKDVKTQQTKPKKDWRRVVGILDDSEFARDMIAETLAIREREREAAREGRVDDPPR